MQMLREKILELGYVLPGDILNVNAFLNHLLDTELWSKSVRLLPDISAASTSRKSSLSKHPASPRQ
jgi:hypothetical protein